MVFALLEPGVATTLLGKLLVLYPYFLYNGNILESTIMIFPTIRGLRFFREHQDMVPVQFQSPR